MGAKEAPPAGDQGAHGEFLASPTISAALVGVLHTIPPGTLRLSWGLPVKATLYDRECNCRSGRAKYADTEGVFEFPAKGCKRMATRSLRTFTVLPNLPPALQGLQQLAYNLWWCWNHDAIALFRRIDEVKFEKAE